MTLLKIIINLIQKSVGWYDESVNKSVWLWLVVIAPFIPCNIPILSLLYVPFLDVEDVRVMK